jgi:hypothetical protein
MNFKKLALIAAMATSLNAFAEGEVGVLPPNATSEYTVEEAQPLLQAELVSAGAGSATVEGNQAYVVQQGNGSLAYISQGTEVGSFAAAVQAGDGALALIYQTGALSSNALIVQRGVEGSGNDVAQYDVTAADTDVKVVALAKGVLNVTPVYVMNDSANVAIINQNSDAFVNVAYIDQSVGDANFAAIVQVAAAVNNLAMVAQVGTVNKAFIHQVN